MTCLFQNSQPYAFSGTDTVLVTGASSGIGAAIALRVNAMGATVIANGRNQKNLEEIKKKAPHPERFHLEPKDLASDIGSLPQWTAHLHDRYGKLHGLAFSAGKTLTMPFMQYTHATALQYFDILCHVPLILSKLVLDRRYVSPNGFSLVFIAAAAAVAPNKGQSIYGAAKAALVCAARCMSKEMAPRGIRVNCISPGLVQTPMLDKTVALLGNDFVETEAPLYPLGLGLPDDIGNLAAFLLSPAARWITGQNILIDGGRLA